MSLEFKQFLQASFGEYMRDHESQSLFDELMEKITEDAISKLPESNDSLLLYTQLLIILLMDKIDQLESDIEMLRTK